MEFGTHFRVARIETRLSNFPPLVLKSQLHMRDAGRYLTT
jgi:hypothetical protein